MNEQWEALRQDCLQCQKCALCQTRTNVVFGAGNPRTSLMFVGEGPGEQEDLSGEAFVGRAGKLLDKFFDAVGLAREQVFIGNMVKCRPPKNRDPKPEEVEQCIGFLREQMRLIGPKLVVCLGRVAACHLISPDFKVTQQHGVWFERDGVRWMGTFHPASILRNPAQKVPAFEDFIKIRDALQSLS